jgi:hypothetical protein
LSEIQFQGEKAKLGYDQYDYEVNQSHKSPEETLQIAQFADQKSTRDFIGNGFKEVSLLGGEPSPAETPQSVSDGAKDIPDNLLAFDPSAPVVPDVPIKDIRTPQVQNFFKYSPTTNPVVIVRPNQPQVYIPRPPLPPSP